MGLTGHKLSSRFFLGGGVLSKFICCTLNGARQSSHISKSEPISGAGAYRLCAPFPAVLHVSHRHIFFV